MGVRYDKSGKLDFFRALVHESQMALQCKEHAGEIAGWDYSCLLRELEAIVSQNV